MKHIGLFEGIGGFSLAARWMGWETLAWCEINPFCQKVLKYHFPHADALTDIKQTDFKKYAGTIDILTGGFPCQPYSTAGQRKGKEDERHLWPEMRRAIREISPRYVLGENVRGLTNWNGGLVFDEVQADLEAEGYEVLPFLLPACAVNAPHRRDRIWFIAHSTSDRRNGKREEFKIQTGREPESGSTGKLEGGFEGLCADGTTTYGNERNREEIRLQTRREINVHGVTGDGDVANSDSFQRCERGLYTPEQEKTERYTGSLDSRDGRGNWQDFPTQPPVCGRNDGVPGGLDGITFSKWRNESIKAYGNAVVPQVVYEIYKAIQAYETLARQKSTPLI